MKPSKQNLLGKIKRADDLDQLKEVEALFKKHFGQLKEKARSDIMHAMIHKEKELKGPDKKKARIQAIRYGLYASLCFGSCSFLFYYKADLQLIYSFLFAALATIISVIIIGLINHYKN